MQFKIPQNVQREDKIIFFLTLKQMIICAGGGTIAYAIYTALAKVYILSVSLIPTVIVVVITLAFAFLKVREIPFYKWLILLIEFYFLVPRKRIWRMGQADPLQSITTIKKKTKEAIAGEKKLIADIERKKRIRDVIELMEKKPNNLNQKT